MDQQSGVPAHRPDRAVMVAVSIMVAGIGGFLALIMVAAANPPYAFDARLLLAMRKAGHPDMPAGPHWLQLAMLDISSLASTTVLFLMMAAIVAYLLTARRPRAALFVLIVLGGGQLLLSLLKLAVDRPRPEIVSHLAEVLTLSFPSGHAMGAAVAYGTLAALACRFAPGRASRICLWVVAVLATLLVGISRVYLGVHWPSDVLAGWCAGAAWAAACWLALQHVSRKCAAVSGQGHVQKL
ncbi:MAG: phosphatase PAP2 family protein [Mesorhizobium sp.]